MPLPTWANMMFVTCLKQVMAEHEGWKHKICDAAVLLSQAGLKRGLDPEMFIWAVLYLCHMVCALTRWAGRKVNLRDTDNGVDCYSSVVQVKETRARMSALQRVEVDLSKQAATSCDQPASEASSSAEDVGKAIDESAGVGSKGTEVAVALDLALHTDHVREWVLSCMAEMQKFTAHSKVMGTSLVRHNSPCVQGLSRFPSCLSLTNCNDTV